MFINKTGRLHATDVTWKHSPGGGADNAYDRSDNLVLANSDCEYNRRPNSPDGIHVM